MPSFLGYKDSLMSSLMINETKEFFVLIHRLPFAFFLIIIIRAKKLEEN